MFSLDNDWREKLKTSLNTERGEKLFAFVEDEYREKKVYPKRENVFRSLNLVPYDEVKVVILGQDPYHGEGQANGLAFAVDKVVALPPSLRNIMEELRADIVLPLCGSSESAKQLGVCFDKTLISWAQQGVLLLNTTLTVRAGEPLSHGGKGWEQLTDDIISSLSKRDKPVVFILWGANAIKKEILIDGRHYIIKSPHPSPLSAHRGFFGSKPFSKANAFLVENGFIPIEWVNTAVKV